MHIRNDKIAPTNVVQCNIYFYSTTVNVLLVTHFLIFNDSRPLPCVSIRC